MNLIRYVTTVDEFFVEWPFFHEGLLRLNDPHAGRSNISPETFAKTLLHIVTGRHEDGIVALCQSKNKKNLGFVAALNCTPPFTEPTAHCYAIYSNGKCGTTIKDLGHAMVDWGKENGFTSITAMSRRMNGSAVRLFTKRWGFRPECFQFRREL